MAVIDLVLVLELLLWGGCCSAWGALFVAGAAQSGLFRCFTLRLSGVVTDDGPTLLTLWLFAGSGYFRFCF